MMTQHESVSEVNVDEINTPINYDETETTSLISKDEQKYIGTHKREGQIIPSIFNMANTVIGAGILAFPFTYLESGLVFGIILTFVVVILSGASMHIVVYCSKKDPSCRSYQDVIRLYLGKFLLIVSEVLFVANLIGANVCFLDIITDSIEPVVVHFFGDEYFFCARWFVMCFVMAFLVFPLTLLREVKKLAFSSTVALFGVLYLTGMMVVLVIIYWASGGVAVEGVVEKIVFNTGSYAGIPKVIISIPIIALSFQGIEIICIPIYYELKNPSLLKMDFIIFSAMILSSMLYIVVGIFGFLRFGDDANSNILLSFPGDNIPVLIARLWIGLTVTLSYPLIFFAMRLAIHSFIAGKNPNISTTEFTITTIIGNAVSLGLALVFNDIGDVFGIVGSFGSVTFVFLYPLMLFWKIITRSKNSKLVKILLYIFVVICMLFSFAILVLGEAVTIIKMILGE